MKIGIYDEPISGNNEAVAFYRTRNPLMNMDVEVGPIQQPKLEEFDWTVRMFDAVLFSRPCTGQALSFIQKCNQCNVPVIVDYDDNLLEIPKSNPVYFHSQGIDQFIDRSIFYADKVITSTETLKNKLATYPYQGGTEIDKTKFTVIPNAYDTKFFSYASKIRKNINKIILWRGTNTHAEDLFTIYGGLGRAIKEYPDWTFVFMGMWPYFIKGIDSRENVACIRWVSFNKYMRFIHNLNPAILICPLVNDEFNNCKSNIAWIESSHAQSITIAPDMEEWKRPGIVNYEPHNSEDFYNKLTNIISMVNQNGGGDQQRELLKVSRDYIDSHLSLDDVNEKRMDVFKEVIA